MYDYQVTLSLQNTKGNMFPVCDKLITRTKRKNRKVGTVNYEKDS